MRKVQILKLGRALRREAEDGRRSVNEAHLLVHEVMLRAFDDDPDLVGTSALHAELSSRLALKLSQRAASCR